MMTASINMYAVSRVYQLLAALRTAACTSGAHAVLAHAWVGMMHMIRGQSIVDQKRLARAHAQSVLQELEVVEDKAAEELKAMAVAVRQAHGQGAISTRNSLLQKSRSKRQQASLVARKKKAIQQHLDALLASELNEQVLSSVQETANVLKNMGLDKAVDQMDSAMADLQDSAVDIGTMQETLATSLALPGADDEDELEAELAMLLSDDTVLEQLPATRTPARTSKNGTADATPAARTASPSHEEPAVAAAVMEPMAQNSM